MSGHTPLSQEDVDRWRNRQLSELVNSLPSWDGAWNVGYSSLAHLTSAETAKIRLHGVVAQDRKSCEAAGWKLVREGCLWAHNWHKLIDSPNYWGRRVAKDVYRWTVRR